MFGKLSPKARLLIIGGMSVLVFFCGIRYELGRLNKVEITQVSQSENQNVQSEGSEKITVQAPKPVTVHVTGAVEKPGVYTLEEGKRIDDAVKLAVPLAKADLGMINLAAVLQDGRQIYVPAKGEKPGSHKVLSAGSQTSTVININTAGLSELDKLDGIGPALAQRIIDYRESKGPFATVEDITKVSGIGPTQLAKFRDKISVD